MARHHAAAAALLGAALVIGLARTGFT